MRAKNIQITIFLPCAPPERFYGGVPYWGFLLTSALILHRILGSEEKEPSSPVSQSRSVKLRDICKYVYGAITRRQIRSGRVTSP